MELFDNLQKLEEMARLGFIKDKQGKKNEYEVYLYTNDPGKIAHFHMRDVETNGQKFNTYIEIEKAEYFHHEGKEDVLNSIQKQNLINFLNEKNSKFFDLTNYQVMIKFWNINNSDVEIDEETEIPNYSQM